MAHQPICGMTIDIQLLPALMLTLNERLTKITHSTTTRYSEQKTYNDQFITKAPSRCE